MIRPSAQARPRSTLILKPDFALIVLSHNVGSLTLHPEYILESLVEVCPHICLLQEAHISEGTFGHGDAACARWAILPT